MCILCTGHCRIFFVIPVPAEAATVTWVAAMVAAPEQANIQLSEYSTSGEQLQTQ